jgi:hypothetical protein
MFSTGFLVAGLGVGFINPPLATAVGIAGLGALLQSKASDKLDAALAGVPLPPGAAGHIAEAVSSGAAAAAARAVRPQARELVAEAARRAFIDGLNEILILAAVVAFAGAALALLLVRRRDFVTAPAEAPA